MKKIASILLITVLFVSAKAQTSNTQVVTNLSSQRFKAIIESDKTAIIIDLRTPDEVAKKGYIKGAIFMDYLSKDFEKELAKLDKTKTYYIYCAAGGRSSDCAELMEKKGFKKVYNLEKGLSDWITQGFPIEKK